MVMWNFQVRDPKFTKQCYPCDMIHYSHLFGHIHQYYIIIVDTRLVGFSVHNIIFLNDQQTMNYVFTADIT